MVEGQIGKMIYFRLLPNIFNLLCKCNRNCIKNVTILNDGILLKMFSLNPLSPAEIEKYNLRDTNNSKL